MSITTLASVSGAPGVTTLAVALTTTWPRPSLLVEADTAKASSILPGYFRGETGSTHSLLNLAVAHRQQVLTDEEFWAQIIRTSFSQFVLPGLPTPAAAPSLTALWPLLSRTFPSLSHAGIDVIIDLGRLALDDPRTVLARHADLNLTVAGATLPDVAALRPRTDRFDGITPGSGLGETTQLVLVETPAGSFDYPSADISRQVGLPVAARIPYDRPAATVYSHGRTESRKSRRSPFTRAVSALSLTIRDTIAKAQEVTDDTVEAP